MSNTHVPTVVNDYDRFKEEIDLVNKYNNEDIYVINSDYSQETYRLLHGMALVRLKRLSPTNKLGLLNVPKVKIPNSSGTGTRTIDHPFPYLNEGVLINIDPNVTNEGLVIGSNVIINPQSCSPQWNPDSQQVVVKNAFYFPGKENENFEGYILIPFREIVMIKLT